ncbi:rhomboid family intramembrane serine protease [Pyxidicoccus parkwayensis]|uniref:Rhomboid family intramembrane serine protease n=1 Tax=Pyxidicoccus parkwayensis TaxID=2813578 RepID=A0ABX7NP54_9BACT|nr:rhomboid family intramembrane serine protease [Pyxidicoccus parkwaysis]QSQ20639.1 rhomboid family intramembrane serine protease [Pyxidicoccus parkwaysis]
MIPISDDNPTLRTPVVTYLLLGAILFTWVVIQGAGLDEVKLAESLCSFALVPAKLAGLLPAGSILKLGDGLSCGITDPVLDKLTPLTSMFLHGGWMHLIGNCLFFWVFGNNVEDSMGRFRFLVFYLACGLAAAGAHVLVDPTSTVPTVGASGAISGIMGAYLVLYPRVRVNLLFVIFIFIRIIPVPAWAVLLWWFAVQVISGLPQLMSMQEVEVSGGVAVWAHVGGFVAGVVLIKLFQNPRYTTQRASWRHRLHPDHP